MTKSRFFIEIALISLGHSSLFLRQALTLVQRGLELSRQPMLTLNSVIPLSQTSKYWDYMGMAIHSADYLKYKFEKLLSNLRRLIPLYRSVSPCIVKNNSLQRQFSS